jgi:predicted small metal-binding protein
MEDAMRKSIDCRDYPSDINCTVAVTADSAEELLDLAAAHAVAAHGHTDTPQLRAVLREMLRDVPDDPPPAFEARAGAG